MVDAARSGQTGDINDYLTPWSGNEVFDLLSTDPGGCLQVGIGDPDVEDTVGWYLTWSDVPSDGHVRVVVRGTQSRVVYSDDLGRSSHGPGVLADANCMAFTEASAVTSVDVFGGPNLEFVTGWNVSVS